MTVHRLADGKLYRLDGNVWVEVKPRVDLERLDNPTPQVNTTCVSSMAEEITPEENERRFRESLRLINSVTHEQLVELMGEEFLEEYRRIAKH